MGKLKKLTKNDFIDSLMEILMDSNFFGHVCNGISHDPEKQILILDMTKEKKNGKFKDVAIRLDLSKIDIELGEHSFDEDGENETFIPKKLLV